MDIFRTSLLFCANQKKAEAENLRFSPLYLSFLFYLRFLAQRTIVRFPLASAYLCGENLQNRLKYIAHCDIMNNINKRLFLRIAEMICNNILEALGNTPIIKLRRMVDEDSAEVLVKFE